MGLSWKPGRGLLGPLKPLMGDWVSLPAEQETKMPMRCTRSFREFGKGWVELDARWDMGARGAYREIAMFGAAENGLGFYSFTNDGKTSKGRLADATEVHVDVIAFEAQMPAGLARMIYWPLSDGAPGFQFAVESRNKRGWTRFLRQIYRPA
jgi:hypothetical protein